MKDPDERPARSRSRSDAEHAGAPASGESGRADCARLVAAHRALRNRAACSRRWDGCGWRASESIGKASTRTNGGTASVLPTYPFERKRYWPESARAAGASRRGVRPRLTTAVAMPTLAADRSRVVRSSDRQPPPSPTPLSFAQRSSARRGVASLLAGSLRLRPFGRRSVDRSAGTGSGFAAAHAGRDAVSTQIRRVDHVPPVDGGAQLARRDRCPTSMRSCRRSVRAAPPSPRRRSRLHDRLHPADVGASPGAARAAACSSSSNSPISCCR